MSDAEGAPAAVVFGFAGETLTPDEEALFRNSEPAGYVLFARNISSPDQVRKLTDSLRELAGNERIPVLIDQEGGRVQRLKPPYWPAYPAMRRFGERASQDPNEAAICVTLNYQLIAADLKALGVNIDCAPVLDLPVGGSHNVIGDRAFADDPSIVGRLGIAVCEGLAKGGVVPVIKHMPGHGRALVDSHNELPRVDASLDELRRTDFLPFKRISSAPIGMTAHIVYAALDAELPGSSSKTVVDDVIRGEIGFDGLLFSDDICMKALTGPVRTRMDAVLQAGCDLALHCDGNFEDMVSIAEDCPRMRPESVARLHTAMKIVDDSEKFDADAAKRRISGFLGADSPGL